MPNVIDVCPTDQTLEMLAQNKLPPAEGEAVLEHVEHCDACARRAAAMPCDDTLVDLVRQAGSKPAVADVGNLVEEIRQLWPDVADEETLNRQIAGRKTDATMLLKDASPESAAAGIALYGFLAPPQQPDELGRLGPYRALEVLGSGGMGVVFRAEDDMLRRQVALKVMLPGIAATLSGKERFLREARSAASVKHEHVVTIYQVDEARGVPFLAMELLKGESLEKRLSREAKLPLADVLKIGREVAEGLAAAHERGLVHRDIKPANIWLESVARKAAASGNPLPARKEEGLSLPAADPSPSAAAFRVKILDFGLACGAREDGRLTRQGIIVGTAAFMSPEQARGETPDARGDLFSLGCVLYSMCTGQLPYTGGDFVSTLVSVVSHSPPHVQELDPSLPADFADLIMQLLEKDPAARPQSAGEVATKLAALEKANRALRRDRTRRNIHRNMGSALSGKTGSARRPATPFLRRPRVVLGLAVLLALLSAGGAWLTFIVLRVETPHGTLFINTEDTDLQLKISTDKEVTLVDLKNPRTGKEISLKVGKYDVELVNAREGLRLKSRHFIIEDGKQSQIEVVFEPRPNGKDKGVFEPKDKGKEFFEPKDKDKKKKGPKGKGFPPDGPFSEPPFGKGGPPPDGKGPPDKGPPDKGPPDGKGPPGGKGPPDRGPKGPPPGPSGRLIRDGLEPIVLAQLRSRQLQ